MTKMISFNELRRVKDALPSGSMAVIADKLGLDKDTVRNYFGGYDFKNGKSVGFHYEFGGNDGGMVMLDDTQILDMAYEIMHQNRS